MNCFAGMQINLKIFFVYWSIKHIKQNQNKVPIPPPQKKKFLETMPEY